MNEPTYEELEHRINELEKTKKRLSLATKAANVGLFDYNVKTREVYGTDAWFTMLGYEAMELPHVFETWVNLLHPDDKENSLSYFENYFKEVVDDKEKMYEQENRMRKKDGTYSWILARGRISDWEGDVPVRFIGTTVDVTDMKKSREKLVEQADELRDWNDNLLGKIDDKTKEINEMNKILSRKNKVLESRDQIVEFILDFHDVNESKSFIVEKILELVDVHQIVIYSLPENNIFNAQLGMKQEENKVTNFSKSELKDFPELPLLDTKNINKAILKGTSKENFINEYALFLPLVKANKHLGYIVIDNTYNKSPVPHEDIDIVADFASLVGIVLFDHCVICSTEFLDETIQDVLKDF